MFGKFQAKFSKARVKANKVILNQPKLPLFDNSFGGGLPHRDVQSNGNKLNRGTILRKFCPNTNNFPSF